MCFLAYIISANIIYVMYNPQCASRAKLISRYIRTRNTSN